VSSDGQGTAAETPPAVTPDTTAPVASAQQRPEVMVGAAFAGGLALALLLRRLGGR